MILGFVGGFLALVQSIGFGLGVPLDPATVLAWDQGIGATLLEIPFPNIDPVAFELGPISIKWYGISYLLGLVLGWLYIRRLVAMEHLWPGGRAPFPPDKTDDLLIYMTVGVIVGGRLGFVLFYEPSTYLQNPLEIFQIWKGGMAFHGALVGCALAVWLFARNNGVSALSAMDATGAAVPLGLIFGRLANFINGELWGRPTDAPWGMVFPEATQLFCKSREAIENWSVFEPYCKLEPTPRHPSQLYESFAEGLLLFLVLYVMTRWFGALKRPGLIIGMFLVGYGVARSTCELFRQYDPLHVLSAYGLTPGIVYSIPMILLGAWLIYRARQNQAQQTA